MPYTSPAHLKSSIAGRDFAAAALSAYHHGDYGSAIDGFERALNLPRYDVRVGLLYADILQKQGNETLAKNILSILTKEHAEIAATHLALANAQIRCRNLDGAKKALEAAVKLQPNDHTVRAMTNYFAAICGGEHFSEPPQMNSFELETRAQIPYLAGWRAIRRDQTGNMALNQRLPLFSADECQTLIAIALSGPSHQGEVGHGSVQTKVRRSLVFRLNWTTIPCPIFKKIISSLEAVAAVEALNLDALESPQIACYLGEDEGFYDEHIDAAPNAECSKRALSLSAELSDPQNFTGGRLELSGEPFAGSHFGSGIVFKSSTPHRVTPVVDGARWSLTCWARSPTVPVTQNIQMLEHETQLGPCFGLMPSVN